MVKTEQIDSSFGKKWRNVIFILLLSIFVKEIFLCSSKLFVAFIIYCLTKDW